nr:BspA family leucine-rich repeat surface protein [Vibrio vulnificus]
TSIITDMSHLFEGSDLIVDISRWDTSNVTDMSYLFADSRMNPDLSNWDTSSVTDMSYMFYRANFFNKSLAKLNTSKVQSMKNMLA